MEAGHYYYLDGTTEGRDATRDEAGGGVETLEESAPQTLERNRFDSVRSTHSLQPQRKNEMTTTRAVLSLSLELLMRWKLVQLN
jgi:hypothetical protein